ncbi:uncharacterized protein PAC_15029 [Phialocephala subalpina]|uniref:Zn(2)-C6 fungal-type domain-containing protein n=1 Tax=Phialocephala subalpina TaxID=576137 RepID=A0A1L7XJB4_9HELO|nr:uncharacterized protein PAC_15029 [Phialocephala subalpina]
MNQAAKPNRACEGCKRKKIKCDGAKPICALCKRIRANCAYPQRKPRVQRRSRSNGPSEIDTISERDSQDSTQQRSVVPTTESVDFTTSMGISESTGEESHLAHFDSRQTASDENVHYLGSPASMGRGPSSQCEHTSLSEQDMLDYLTEALPDIWMPEAIPQSDSFATSMMTGETNLNFFSLENTGSQPAPNEESHHQDLQSHSRNGHNRMDVPRNIRARTESYSIDVPSDVVDDLLNLYFRRIQVFLPLFHKPTFHLNYVSRTGTADYNDLEKDSQFVLYGMMALSARFSTMSYFDGISLKERGSPFSRKAQMIYQETIQGFEPHVPTLKWLQGCILLAFYNQSCGPAVGCDLMPATCTRLAYSLGLHRIDEDSCERKMHPKFSSEGWISKEEQRRAWWSVWELDAFDSISSRRPFSIDKHRMSVFLPVSDEVWFSGTPTDSAILNTDILQCWKSLRDSDNRDERAWFLISNFITVQTLELCQQRHVPAKNITDVETVVSCFALLFHEKFGRSANQLVFDEQNYGKSNWLILTRLMIQGGHIATRMLSRRASSEPILTGSNRFVDKAYAPSITLSPAAASPVTTNMLAAIANTSIEDYIQPATEAFRIYQSWSPEFIRFCPPPMVCIITGPAAIMLRFARHLRKIENAGGDPGKPSIKEDLLILILSKFARYWNIGLLLLGTHYRLLIP